MKEDMDKKIEIGGREFVIEANFRKSCRLAKYRNKMKYGGLDITEENKEYILEIEKLREETKEGVLPDISKLSKEALKILQKMSDNNADVFNEDELIDIGMIIFELNETEIDEIYEKEFNENGYDELVSKILYGLTLVFMNAKSGSTSKKIKSQTKVTRINEVAKQ